MAQYPSSSSIATAFRVNNNNNNNVLGNFHQDHHLLQYVLGHQVLIKNGTSDPEMSELTCNFVSASTTTTRKRKNSTRGGMPHQHYLNQQHQENYNSSYYFPANSSCCRRITKLPKLDQLISVKKKSVEENRLNQSGGASTSGQLRRRRYQHDDEDAVLVPLPLPPPQQQHSQHLTSSSYSNYLLHQNLDDDDDEIDALIRLQHETLRSVVEQTQQRQCRLLLSVLEQQQVQRRLKEKQIELENAWVRNAELEEKVKQLSSENQMWFNVAKNNEAIVLSLRSTLEHQLLLNHLLHHQKKNQNTTTKTMGRLVEAEGFGDSSDHGGVAADDAQSSNNNNYCHQQQQLQVNVGERVYNTTVNNVDLRDHDDNASMMMKQQQQQQQQQHRKMCKVCKEMEVSVLLLPCRHLCLCKDCEAKLQACPICNSFKNASLQIFM